MTSLTTGLINNLEPSGGRKAATVSLRVVNRDSVSTMIRINGFYQNSTAAKTEYALDILTLPPGGEETKNYFTEFDSFQFCFTANSDAVMISAWGKNSSGNFTEVYNVYQEQLFLSKAGNQIYVPLSADKLIAVVDGRTDTLRESIEVGFAPYGINTNPLTGRVYASNFMNNTVMVLDGETNTVIANIFVSSNPVGIGVNPLTNRVYVANWGSSSVAVIDGLSNIVIDEILVCESPTGIQVNPQTNRIYVTNQKSVSVINGNTNTVLATVRLANSSGEKGD